MIFALFLSFCVFFCLVFVLWDWFEDWENWAEDEDDWDLLSEDDDESDWRLIIDVDEREEEWDLRLDWLTWEEDDDEKKTKMRFESRRWWTWSMIDDWLWCLKKSEILRFWDDCEDWDLFVDVIDDREKSKFREKDQIKQEHWTEEHYSTDACIDWRKKMRLPDWECDNFGQWWDVFPASFVVFEPWGAVSLWCARYLVVRGPGGRTSCDWLIAGELFPSFSIVSWWVRVDSGGRTYWVILSLIVWRLVSLSSWTLVSWRDWGVRHYRHTTTLLSWWGRG